MFRTQALHVIHQGQMCDKDGLFWTSMEPPLYAPDRVGEKFCYVYSNFKLIILTIINKDR